MLHARLAGAIKFRDELQVIVNTGVAETWVTNQLKYTEGEVRRYEAALLALETPNLG